ncbi:MAG: pyruvate formate lyase family protein [Dehalococcoidia bacterium]|nr:pyruvate formate lyase family protein [Dehalococcoidia bacterium]
MLELKEVSFESQEYRQGMVVALGSTDRIRRLNERLHSTPQSLCLHRARAYTAVYAETEGQPPVLRRAKALKRTLEELPVTIADDELIVGRRACRARCVPVVPECHGGWLLRDLEGLPYRPQDPFQVPAEQMAEAKQILETWKGKTLYDHWIGSCPPEISAKTLRTGWADASSGVFFLGYHFTPPWEKITTSGLQPFEEQARNRLSQLDRSNAQDMGKEHFLNALLIVVDGVKTFAGRYADEALRLASLEKDARRRQDLQQIAEACRRVPYLGARSFYEAIQAMWLIHMAIQVEATGPVFTPGRFDQYMYPFYKADIEKGVLTREQAQELIEHLFLNMTNNLFLYDSLTAIGAAGFSQFQVVSLGGIDANGKDASNELSYLCLDAVKAVRTVQPDIVLLCHPRETPYELKMKAADLVQLGLGLPKFINTETNKIQLMELGYTRAEASLGWIRGCSEPFGPGSKQYGHTAGAFVNVPMSLEMVLFDGVKRSPGQNGSGQRLGLPTGDPTAFETFDQFMDAFRKQISKQIEDAHIAGSYMEIAQQGPFPQMLQSLLTDDCIGRCLPANAGGARITVGPGLSFPGGWATVGNSLAAIKKLVYEEKKISMGDLVKAIDADFEGYRDIQQMLLNDAPKFGNDDDYVDDLTREIFVYANGEARNHVGPLGNRNTPGTDVSVAHIAHGNFVWATPDGREAGTPLSDNVGPMTQTDKEGPVAHINSVTKLGMERQFGSIHNLYVTNLDSDEKKHRLIDLVDAYHSRGGHHLQANCVDKKVLLDAQEHPEKYPTLMVRVAGYVAYFIDLSKKVQDQIIGRTSIRL